MNTISSQKGASIIAVIAIMLILAVMGAALVSLVTTGSDISINQLQSEQALYVAEGGKEYILASGNRTFPNYSTQGATINLGGIGSTVSNFKVDTPAYLTVAVAIGNTTITVNDTSKFATAPGRIVIDSEVMAYTAKAATTFTIFPGATAAHTNGNAVYPVTTVTPNPIAIGDLTINVASTTGFAIPGTVKIDSEYIYCASTNTPLTTQFTNCIRGYKNTIPAAHAVNSNVFQYIITSTGTVGNAQRVVRIAADRGEAITNGTFQNNVNNWTEVNTKTEGTSGWDNAAGNPAGSLISKTNDCVGTVCRGLWFQGYREQILATPIPSGANVTLQLQYSKSVIGTAGGSVTDMSVVIVYQDSSTSIIWSDTSEATIGFTPVNQSFVSANIITGIRLVYNLKNPAGPAGDNTQRKVWFDEVSLATPGGALNALTWQESY